MTPPAPTLLWTLTGQDVGRQAVSRERGVGHDHLYSSRPQSREYGVAQALAVVVFGAGHELAAAAAEGEATDRTDAPVEVVALFGDAELAGELDPSILRRSKMLTTAEIASGPYCAKAPPVYGFGPVDHQVRMRLRSVVTGVLALTEAAAGTTREPLTRTSVR